MIDTHTHIVAADEERYPLTPRSLSGEWYKETPHDAEAFLACMDACGVEAAVLVQPVGAYSYDNSYTADSAGATPNRFVAACCIDVEAKGAPETLRYWVTERGAQGVRLFALSKESHSWLDATDTFRVWEVAEELGIHVIVTIFPHQLPQLRNMLERYPSIEVSLDHCGFPTLTGPPWKEAAPLFELAEYSNLHCKISTNVLDSAARAGASAVGFVDQMARVFGAERLMWGSDFCQTHNRNYANLVELAIEAFSGLSSEERHACFVGTAQKLWPGLSPVARPSGVV
jgi:L-fuconolactonase